MKTKLTRAVLALLLSGTVVPVMAQEAEPTGELVTLTGQITALVQGRNEDKKQIENLTTQLQALANVVPKKTAKDSAKEIRESIVVQCTQYGLKFDSLVIDRKTNGFQIYCK